MDDNQDLLLKVFYLKGLLLKGLLLKGLLSKGLILKGLLHSRSIWTFLSLVFPRFISKNTWIKIRYHLDPRFH